MHEYIRSGQWLLWLLTNDRRLSRTARRILNDPDSRLVVSVASLWEILLKHRAGRLELNMDVGDLLSELASQSSWRVLPVAVTHLPAFLDLPNVHKDPFDRLLIAQARSEGMVILTAHSAIRRYPVATAW